jgi:hypothetical protein
MKSIFEKRKAEASKAVAHASDSTLNGANYAEELFRQLKINPPILQTEKTQTDIGVETISFHNAPPGPFTPGQKMEYAIFKVPVGGDIKIFAALAGNFGWDGNLKRDDSNIYYRELSSKKIDWNDEVIASIRENAKARFQGVMTMFDKFQSEAKHFNEEDLKPFISKLIDDERKRRNSLSESSRKLNPFT